MTRKDPDLGPIDRAPAMAQVLDLVAWMIETERRPLSELADGELGRDRALRELRQILPAARDEVAAFENLRRSLS